MKNKTASGFLRIVLLITVFISAGAFLRIRADAENPVSQSTGRTFIGEKLVYTVKWDPPWYFFFLPKMEAGEVELLMKDEVEYKNGKALSTIFLGRSSGKLSSLAGVKVDDCFEFLTDPETFCTNSVSMKIREMRHKKQINVTYLRETRQLHFYVLDESVDPPKVKKDEYKNDVPDCIHDPISAVYLLRQMQLHEGLVRNFIVGNDDKYKEVRCMVEKKEKIQTIFGESSAWRVNTIAMMGNLFKEGGQFRIWFSADDKKIPLQFEAKVRLGHIIGKIKKIESPRKSAVN
jgi:hypothetical protein